MQIASRVAVVTGASSGIGAEIARQLGASGVRVGLTARRIDPMEELAEEIRSRGGTAAVAVADAAEIEATRAAIRRLAGQLGPVDLLIANAGVGVPLTVEEFSAEAMAWMVRVNLVGAVAAIEAVLPSMLERGNGQLVGISSLAGFRGLPGVAGYSATKAGLTTFLEGLRIELKGRGIGVTTVHPGYVATPMIAGGGRKPFVMEPEQAARIILRGIAARRREVNFPGPMVALARLGRWLPAAWYELLIRRAMRES